MKHTYMTLAIIAALSLTACGGSDDKDMVKDKDTSTGSTQDQDKDKNKDKDQGSKGSDSGSSSDSSASSDSTGNYGDGVVPTVVSVPPPKKLLVDEEKLPRDNQEVLKAREKPEGDGTVVVWWDTKFKAMNSVNRNLKKDGSGNIKSNSFNPDGTRFNLDTSWDKISITAPNTIVGHDGTEANLVTSGFKPANGSNYLAPRVVEEATLDLIGAQQGVQDLTIKLQNGKEVTIEYQADVLNLGDQDGDYVAQAVHVFGTELAENGDEKPLEMAYVYGEKTKDSFDGAENLPSETVKYEGIATYLKHSETNVYRGTASFDVQFPTSSTVKISNGKISIPDVDINYAHSGKYETGEGTSFDVATKTSPDKFSNSGNFKNPKAGVSDRNDIRLRGRFYGKNAQYLGGTFYNNEGAGTFFTGDKERGGEVKAQGRR